MMTAVLLLLPSGCATTIKDSQWCSPPPGHIGAACDWFLHSDQQILTESQWEALQESWAAKGDALECTTSTSLGDIKAELEQLCSKTACTYEQVSQLKIAIQNIERILQLKTQSRAMTAAP